VFVAQPELRDASALVAYGYDLLRRIDNVAEGPVSLALWRRFAWTPQGSPKHGFELSAEAIVNAEDELKRCVRMLSPGPEDDSRT
jgi:hypothetical protein